MGDVARSKGGCLCGAVRFSASPAKRAYGACHCSMCRRWTAGPFFATDCGTSLVFEDDGAVGVFRSSEWAERLFCRNCGTPLAYRLIEPGVCYVSSEAFDESQDFEFAAEIFVDEKPPHYRFANDTFKLTGPEVFAQFGGQDEKPSDMEKAPHG